MTDNQKEGWAIANNSNVENLTLGIDGPPKVHLPTSNPDEHFVQVPSRVWSRTLRSQVACNGRSERRDPAPDGLVRDHDPAFREEVLDVTETEREPDAHPDG